MNILIIGTGPAALMAGSQLINKGHKITFFEQKKAAARKFLVAGHGGFNLSNTIEKAAFLNMYNRAEIQKMVAAFDENDLVTFLQSIGIGTYIGSSGKVFPEKHIKPIDVLQAWLKDLQAKGAQFFYEKEMVDFDNEKVYFFEKGSMASFAYDKLILALGGASWAKTGATGKWLPLFESKGIKVLPFEASNAGFHIDNIAKLGNAQGEAIKNITCRLGNKEKYGEIVITDYGMEGAPIYFLNSEFRAGNTTLYIDCKPQFEVEKIESILQKAKNISQGLKDLKIAKPFIAYIKNTLSKEQFLNTNAISPFIKNLPFEIEKLRPIEEAISTVGGLSFEAVNEDLSLKLYPNIYCCGEMLDWDAPTGGYLLQACFASGFWVANGIK